MKLNYFIKFGLFLKKKFGRLLLKWNKVKLNLKTKKRIIGVYKSLYYENAQKYYFKILYEMYNFPKHVFYS